MKRVFLIQMLQVCSVDLCKTETGAEQLWSNGAVDQHIVITGSIMTTHTSYIRHLHHFHEVACMFLYSTTQKLSNMAGNLNDMTVFLGHISYSV